MTQHDDIIEPVAGERGEPKHDPEWPVGAEFPATWPDPFQAPGITQIPGDDLWEEPYHPHPPPALYLRIGCPWPPDVLRLSDLPPVTPPHDPLLPTPYPRAGRRPPRG
jgi:hypothetical protein